MIKVQDFQCLLLKKQFLKFRLKNKNPHFPFQNKKNEGFKIIY